MPTLLPALRCALTTPFHPYLKYQGGILSVALSVDFHPPGVTWHFALWSPDFPLVTPATAQPTQFIVARPALQYQQKIAFLLSRKAIHMIIIRIKHDPLHLAHYITKE